MPARGSTDTQGLLKCDQNLNMDKTDPLKSMREKTFETKKENKLWFVSSSSTDGEKHCHWSHFRHSEASIISNLSTTGT